MSTRRPAGFTEGADSGPPAADVVVVGGGISGLAAAYELQRRGLSVRLVEASPRLGGVILTERVDGWVIDAGPDSMLVQKPAAIELCRELGIEDRLIPTLPPRTASVLRNGRLHPIVEGSFLGFPITARALAGSSLFSLLGKARMACELLVPPRQAETDESVADFVGRRFGREAVAYLAEPLLAGIHAGDVTRLSVRALFPRLVEAERTAGSVLRSLRGRRTAPSPRGAFVSFPGGVGVLVEALTTGLDRVRITTSSPVTRIVGSSPFMIETAAERIAGRALVLAVPAYAAAALLRALDVELAARCEEVPYASTATVAFGFRRDQVQLPLQGSGFVVPKAESRALLAATWTSSKWPGRAPEGHVLMRGFLGGGRDPGRLEENDDALRALALDELARTAGIVGPPVLSRLYRWTRQSPQFEVGHLERVAAIEARLRHLPGVFVTGSGFRAIGIPDCIADGRAAGADAAAFLTGPQA
jgi:oxygen-dependent protoporphyrinogen oxidase